MVRRRKSRGRASVIVTFVLPEEHPHAKSSVVGDFNAWDPSANPLQRRNNGTCSATIELEAGMRYAFRYLGKDDQWFDEPDCDGHEAGSYGSDNCILAT